MKMNRREFLGSQLGAAGVLMAGCSHRDWMRPRAATATEGMNIVHILIEDWSAFAMGCYGNKIVKTPNVDRLAARGVRFDRAYCQAPVCNPSRASFCTGLRPDTTRVYGNPDHMDTFMPNRPLPFIGSILKSKGAYTVEMGKLVHKWQHARRFESGFDRIEWTHDYDKPGAAYQGVSKYVPVPPGTPKDFASEWKHLPNRAVAERLESLRQERDAKIAAGHPDNWEVRKPFQQLFAEQTGDSGLKADQMEDGRLARAACRTLAELARAKKQFFLSIGFYSTHTPLLSPRAFADMYDPNEMPLTEAPAEKDRKVPMVAKRNGKNYDIFNGMYPEYQPTEANQRRAIAGYYGCASYVDAQIGIVLEALEKEGLADNTIIILFSDHGFQLGEHGCWSKFTLFEQSTRVPLIAYVPGNPANGSRCDEIVELVDFLPTLCDLWGIPESEQFEGNSFAPQIFKPDTPGKKAAFSMIPIGGLGRSVRTKRYKYAEWRKSKALPGSEEQPFARELYDLESDPYEQHNLIDERGYEPTTRELADLLKQGWKAAAAEGR